MQSAHRIAARDIAAPDIESLAAAILGLDLLVSVDTMVAHLGGALGAPVWTLLHADCDWRWPAEGRTTVWYPTMGLFHQRSPDDWESAIAEVARELQTMAAAIPARPDSAALKQIGNRPAGEPRGPSSHTMRLASE